MKTCLGRSQIVFAKRTEADCTTRLQRLQEQDIVSSIVPNKIKHELCIRENELSIPVAYLFQTQITGLKGSRKGQFVTPLCSPRNVVKQARGDRAWSTGIVR